MMQESISLLGCQKSRNYDQSSKLCAYEIEYVCLSFAHSTDLISVFLKFKKKIPMVAKNPTPNHVVRIM